MKDHYLVFISSTYLDNVARRRVVLEAVRRAGRMVAVGMEEQFTADERPTVEVCRSRAAECDVLVGIVAHRYGWEPEGQVAGEEKSITWLEYEAAREAGRPRLMFEIDPRVPFTLAELDPDDCWRKQERLQRFKARYAKDQLPTVFREDNLGMLVQQALSEWRERHEVKGEKPPPPPSSRSPGPNTSLDEQIKRYGNEAIKTHGSLDLNGFEKRLRVPIDLEELYVPLRATSDLRGHGRAAFSDAGDARKQLERAGHGREASLMEAFDLATSLTPKRSGLVILGDPGAGKTTHLRRLLICCLKEGSEKLGLPAGMVPVFLPLRALEDPERETVDQFIVRHLNKHLGLSDDFGRELLRRGNLLLLFDGLDEVANPGLRVKIARWVEQVLRAHSSCRPVVTCRFAGYGEQKRGTPEVRLNAEFLELHIQPLRDHQPEEFVRKWYRLVESGLDLDRDTAARRATERADDLIATLKRGDLRTARMAELVGNPLLLANLCLVHRSHGRLPQDRRRLYDECVDVLLERWQERQGPSVGVKAEQAKEALQPVAKWLHREEGRTRATASELEPVLEPALKAARWETGGAREFLARVRDESGLLTGWGPDQFGFMHLGFQEYLAASELRRLAAEAGEKQGAVLADLAGHYGESWWQEVLLLFVAMGNPSMFGPLMREVVKRPAFAEQRELLGLLLEEAAKREPGPFMDLVRQEPGRDAGLWRRQRVALEALRQMGEKEGLTKLAASLRGHPSPEIQDWLRGAGGVPAGAVVTEKGGVELVPIPGGEFLMGSPPDEEGRRGNEGPQHRVRVSPFWLGRYPVTNEQYGRFMKENPHIEVPEFWGDRQFNQAQQPVVGVTWDEAKAFAEWTGGRLPREAEWEYACRAGTTAARYDKDLNAIAWYGENSRGRTHPVGEKKPNAWGLHDMLGNVWEWVGDWYGPYSTEPMTDTRRRDTGYGRVVRGGSWFNDDPSLVRGAVRYGDEPWLSGFYVGFRCARGVATP